MVIESPALDAMMGRKGVRIRATFIEAGGYRLHTIESLDQPLTRTPHAPTEIFNVERASAEHSARMFFIADPDGVRCELVEMAVWAQRLGNRPGSRPGNGLRTQ